MNTKVVVEEDKVYGRMLIYPLGENGKLLAKLTKKKTLSRPELKIIEKLGFTVVWAESAPKR